MDKNFLKEFIKNVAIYSPKCFINSRNEFIIVPKENVYFLLDDIKTELDLKCKVIAWLSRPSCKGFNKYWQKRIRCIFNDCLEFDFTFEQIETIYTYLGNDCNRSKTIKFIESNYDFNILNK